jgi:hypothetical protein
VHDPNLALTPLPRCGNLVERQVNDAVAARDYGAMSSSQAVSEYAMWVLSA